MVKSLGKYPKKGMNIIMPPIFFLLNTPFKKNKFKKTHDREFKLHLGYPIPNFQWAVNNPIDSIRISYAMLSFLLP